ncbi:hypothetical protein SAMN04488503_1797 [Humidesulfovibrio mexicanus]|uniref:Anti-sigma-28 factor FlgM C-terminal domain-containing protein n=1 Tax=Humidesulfovibrio mexicanus TaxID=147047 RepID=A0A239A4R2_9BACT|nr:hypothetical protein [Humidesulfovibrio mexicanus]SNR90024.1 hypothetical protein SAMN04488503_1797 [Humidesulfovibrio mexicanus]
MNNGDSRSLGPREGPPSVVEDEDAHTERLAYLDDLKSQIRSGVYRPEVRDLARSLASMLVRDL